MHILFCISCCVCRERWARSMWWFLSSWSYFSGASPYFCETVKFGPERMYIDCWVKKRTYDTFKEILGSGMQYHLQSNEFLRNVFELGPPVMLDAATLKTMKISRFERHLYNSAAFKARTKARSKCRDKRADVGEFF
uniref:Interferon-related developmental regulator C-terminal domain-containing protein n=1 Tax=Sus scrofa TaxID=9823 RepID=A0A8D1TJ15_PIG